MSGSSHQRALERLAREAQLPMSEVVRLYDEARTHLEVGARIKAFLGIFALRNVRKMLREKVR